MNVFSRSWDITKLCFNVMRQDKELFLFPILASIFSVTFMVLMVVPAFFLSVDVTEPLGALLLFAIYFGLAFIATFFNVCVVYTTKKRFEGGNATFAESLSFASSRIHLILGWALLSATVGLLLRILDNLAERFGEVGEIIMRVIVGMLGAAWSILTIFVVPSMVYKNIGPIDAIKNSAYTLKKTWGESLVRHFGLGLAQLVLIVAGIACAIVLAIIAGMIHWSLVLVVIALGILYIIVVALLFSVANTIFNTALFVYAETGKMPTEFKGKQLEHAFSSAAQQ